MKNTLVFEVVEIFKLSTGNTVLTCTPNKFEDRIVTSDNSAMIKIGGQPERNLIILGEDINVRSDISMPVKYSNFQTPEDLAFLKKVLGKERIILKITY